MRMHESYRVRPCECYGDRVDELSAIADRIVRRDTGGARGPWTLEVYPTLACNLSCGFCDTTDRHRPPVNELSPARMRDLINEAAALGVRRVFILGGGEPLLAAHTPAMMRQVKTLGMEGILTTNGTLMGDSIRRMMVEVGWDEVHVSIDGARPATHDFLRGRVGAFDRSIRALCRLRALRTTQDAACPRLALHTVITRENVEEIPDIVRLAAAVGAERVEFDGLIAYRPEQQAHALDDAGRIRLSVNAHAGADLATTLGLTTTLHRFFDPIERGSKPPKPGTGKGFAAAPCLKAWHSLVVQADGKTSPCCVLAGIGESVAHASLSDTWENSASLTTIRAGMLAGQPTGRCAECSENILAHERAIRARLPAA